MLFVPAAGDVVANVNSDTVDGVPAKAPTNVLAAPCRLGRSPPTEPERSATMATLSPHLAVSVGLMRLFCQMPPEAL